MVCIPFTTMGIYSDVARRIVHIFHCLIYVYYVSLNCINREKRSRIFIDVSIAQFEKIICY